MNIPSEASWRSAACKEMNAHSLIGLSDRQSPGGQRGLKDEERPAQFC